MSSTRSTRATRDASVFIRSGLRAVSNFGKAFCLKRTARCKEHALPRHWVSADRRHIVPSKQVCRTHQRGASPRGPPREAAGARFVSPMTGGATAKESFHVPISDAHGSFPLQPAPAPGLAAEGSLPAEAGGAGQAGLAGG